MASGRKTITGDELRHLYLGEKYSLEEVAKHFGVSRETIRRRLAEIGCPIRHPTSLAGTCDLVGCERYGKGGQLANDWVGRAVKGTDGQRRVMLRMVVCRRRRPSRQLHAWFVGPHGDGVSLF